MVTSQQVWLVLVLVTHVTGTGQDCKSESVAGHILDQDKSREQGASVEVLKLFRTEDELGCVKDCCSGKSGNCTVAGFNNQTKDVNCYHFHCSPLSSCAFLASKMTASFKVQPRGVVPTPASTTTTPSGPANATVPKDGGHSERQRTTTGRKGVSYSEEQESHVARGDGTFSKPRKGVLSESPPEDAVPKKDDNTGVKPRKGVDSDPSQSTEGSTPMPSRKPDNTSELNPTSSTSVTTLQTSPPPTIPSHSLLTTPGMHRQVVSTQTPENGDEKTSVMAVPLFHALGSNSSINPQPSVPARSTTSEAGAFKDEPSSTEQKVATKPSSNTTTTSQPLGVPNEEDLKFSMSSMHIVVALVMGLLLLFVVLGIVGRQIYDIWLRRHYHRMDFLIDGMYDSYA